MKKVYRVAGVIATYVTVVPSGLLFKAHLTGTPALQFVPCSQQQAEEYVKGLEELK